MKLAKTVLLYPVKAGVFVIVGTCVVLGITTILLAGAFQALADEN